MAKNRRPEIAGVGDGIFGAGERAGAQDLLPQMPAAALEDLEIDSIDPNPYQPRDTVEEDEALHELAASIREHGILQPIRVRVQNGRYQLIVGERRWRAARLAGLDAIPAIVAETNDDDMRVQAIIENIQREDLNDIERARALQDLKVALGLTWDQVGERVGITRSTVMRIVGLRTLPPPIQEHIAVGRLTEKHGRALRRLKNNPDKLLEVAEVALREGLTGDETDRLVSVTKSSPRATYNMLTQCSPRATLPVATKPKSKGKLQSNSVAIADVVAVIENSTHELEDLLSALGAAPGQALPFDPTIREALSKLNVCAKALTTALASELSGLAIENSAVALDLHNS